MKNGDLKVVPALHFGGQAVTELALQSSHSIEQNILGKRSIENSAFSQNSVASSLKSGLSDAKSAADKTKPVKSLDQQPQILALGNTSQPTSDEILRGASEPSARADKAPQVTISRTLEGDKGEMVKIDQIPEMKPGLGYETTKRDTETSVSGRRSRSELGKETKSEDETHKEHSTLLGASTLNASQSGTKSLSITLNTNSNPSEERKKREAKDINLNLKTDSNEVSRPTESSSRPLEQTDTHETKLSEVQSSSKPEGQGQRWWKNKYGLKMSKSVNEVIKNAFKSSPRTPLGVTQPSPNGGKMKRSAFSADEDDIFGGLDEEDNASKEGARYKEDTVSRLVAEAEGRTVEKAKNRATKEKLIKESVEKSEKKKKLELDQQSPTNEANTDKRHLDSSQKSGGRAAESIHSNDRSGTVLDESEVLNDVNSDITSSLVGGAPNWAKSATPNSLLEKKNLETATSEELDGKEPLSPGLKNPEKAKPDEPRKDGDQSSNGDSDKATKNPKSQKATKASKASKTSKSEKGKRSKKAEKRSEKSSKKRKGSDTNGKEDEEGPSPIGDDDDTLGESFTSLPPPPQEGSMFLNIGCGIVDSFTNGGVCTFSKKDAVNAAEDSTGASVLSATSSADTGSRLTDLEKRVWNDWDRRDTGTTKKWNSDIVDDNKEDHDKKRQVARGKLLDYASSAISSQMITGSVMTSSVMLSRLQQDSSDYTDCSSSTGDSGDSSLGGNDSKDTASYSDQSDASDDGPTQPKVDVGKPMPATPILLSFSQRSLVEKFTKNLATNGVEVLKLNTRKQWQLRYFTVSKEQIPLAAHESKSHSGDVAQCPKALLWLKKFNPKNGGYGLTNIDKNGHGGMMLAELTDVTVTNKADTENPLPKKLLEKFRESVLVTLDYTMNGGFRSVSFRCKSNDEAQFLCTCMRVIRDLLKREQFLRLRTPAFVKGNSLKVQS